jgi:hypothetical protein
MDKLTSDDVLQYMDTFLGYGNLRSQYWFIGKEEGVDKEHDNKELRIHNWIKLGKKHTLDLVEAHHTMGYPEKSLRKLQPTWVKLAQLLQTLEHGFVRYETLRDYLSTSLGRAEGNHALLELMPLPSSSTSYWGYTDGIFQTIPALSNRQRYFDAIKPKRIVTLKNLIRTYKPKLVLFYSTTPNYITYWNEITNSNSWTWKPIIQGHKTGWQKIENTLYLITPHPTAFGINRLSFEHIGSVVKTLV